MRKIKSVYLGRWQKKKTRTMPRRIMAMRKSFGETGWCLFDLEHEKVYFKMVSYSINISDVKYVDNSLAIEAVMNCYPM